MINIINRFTRIALLNSVCSGNFKIVNGKINITPLFKHRIPIFDEDRILLVNIVVSYFGFRKAFEKYLNFAVTKNEEESFLSNEYINLKITVCH